MMQPNRRIFLISSALTAAGCAGRRADELRIFVYAGGHEKTMRTVFLPRFEALTGATATLHSGWWDSMAKLKSAPANDPPFDLMITDATQGYPAAREGLFAPIDFDAVPNHKSLAAAALDNWVFRDRLGLTYPDAVQTIAYHKSKQETAPARWSDLLRPDLKGKIGLYNHFYMSLYTFACAMADQEGKQGTATAIVQERTDDLFRFAREYRNQIGLWWPNTTDMMLALADKRVLAGNMHSPEYMQALREKPELGAAVPDLDRAMVQVFWAIPAGTPRKSLAHEALNLLFSHEVQLEFARRGMATARSDTAQVIAAEDPLWKSFYPYTADQFQSLRYYPYEFYASRWDELADRWERTVLRAG